MTASCVFAYSALKYSRNRPKIDAFRSPAARAQGDADVKEFRETLTPFTT